MTLYPAVTELPALSPSSDSQYMKIDETIFPVNKIPRGMRNQHNTCYALSSTHLLFHARDLKDAVFSAKCIAGWTVIHKLNLTFSQLDCDQLGPRNPVTLQDICKDIGKRDWKDWKLGGTPQNSQTL